MSRLDEEIVDAMLGVLRNDILPMTHGGTAAGNKVFGAAVLDRESLELVIAGTNEETSNPLFHGEVSCLNRYWAMEQRPPPEDCLFLSTHEPCSLCLSAITWSGFDNFYYLFSYEDSRDAFNIPHDLKILDEVFGCKDGEYRRRNAFWTSYALGDLIAAGSTERRSAWETEVAQLRVDYNALSDTYQSNKGGSDIPLA